MSFKQVFAVGMLAVVAAVVVVPVHSQEVAKDPKSGKKCVSFISSEMTDRGLTRLNYRNICANPFQIRIQAGERLREGGIEAGSPEKPSKAFVTCKPDERCEVAKWSYE